MIRLSRWKGSDDFSNDSYRPCGIHSLVPFRGSPVRLEGLLRPCRNRWAGQGKRMHDFVCRCAFLMPVVPCLWLAAGAKLQVGLPVLISVSWLCQPGAAAPSTPHAVLSVVVASCGLMCLLCVAAPCGCLLYTSPSPRDATLSRMPSSA